jgi:hypothetical protein
MLGHALASDEEFQIELARQRRDEFLISVGFLPPQLVIEMNNRKNNAELAPQLQQNSQERNGINPTGNGDTNAIPCRQQFLPPNGRNQALRQ